MRSASLTRKTKETSVSVKINIDGDSGNIDISTGIGFFDHMLTALAVHAAFDLTVKVNGDLEVDGHHTVEDTAIVLGKALKEALGDKSDIKRFGSAYIPMDEALAFASIDISGREYLVFDAKFNEEKVGDFDSCLVEELMRAFCFNAGITLHIKVLYGKNSHHMIEACFKALAHALKQAVCLNDSNQVLSSKGSLD